MVIPVEVEAAGGPPAGIGVELDRRVEGRLQRLGERAERLVQLVHGVEDEGGALPQLAGQLGGRDPRHPALVLEENEPVIERLLEAGALDVYLTPVIMKRSRPGVVLTALAEPSGVGELARILFRETTTIGVRWHGLERARLPRELVRVETSLGPVTFKVSRLGGRAVTVTPEFEEVRRIARERARPVREVLEQVRAEGVRILGEPG